MEKTTIKLQKLLSGLFLLLASYGLLFLMPIRVNLLSWIIFAISTFIFCIGAYWVGSAFDGPTGDAFVKGKRIFLRTAAVLLFAVTVFIC